MQEILEGFISTIRHAAETNQPLRICGLGSKDFYGGALQGSILDATPYAGIVDYEPAELVLTARCGTRLADIENLLARHGQMLAFEPPYFGKESTLGGVIAAGLSGPRRAYAGAVRDFVLGVRMLDGHGNHLKFGGQVMKNVAGYDISRLMVGSLGTLGVLTEISLKVLPIPEEELTLCFSMDTLGAIETMNRWAGLAWPISATCHCDNMLNVRLSGRANALRLVKQQLGGDVVEDGAGFWRALRNHELPFFDSDLPLWRYSVPSTAPLADLPVDRLIEWNGSLRWILSALDARVLRDGVSRIGGQTTLFRGGDKAHGVFHHLLPAMEKIHRKLKKIFDPAGIFNPGRMYPNL